jgi:hypothetical protein
MNYKVINLALAVILFISAYLAFDFNDGTQTAIAIVLFLSGIHSLFLGSESRGRKRFGRACLRLAAVISVFLIAKLLIFG